MNDLRVGKCVYILKTNENLYKIGKTKNLQKRLSAYSTHLPTLFKVVRQFMAENMEELEAGLHAVLQHKRVKGEWFRLNPKDLIICDNIAQSYAFQQLEKRKRKYKKIHFSENPLLQVLEANEKYLRDYDPIVKDVKLGLSTSEILELHEGEISKTTVQTIKKLLKYQTPNSEFISRWLFVVSDLENGLTIEEILAKHKGRVSRATIQIIRRILINQLY